MSFLTPHQQAALNYNEHISLTANAGSGKTFVLSKRYVEIALNEDISLHNLVAITFTEKAAAELYKKISEEIELRFSEEKDNNIKKKLDRLRRQLVSANISTIHSFCIYILKEFPAEAQIDANFTPIDKTLSEELIQLSIEEVIGSNLRDTEKSKELKYLIRIFGSKYIFSLELASIIEKRKNVLFVKDKIYSKSEEEIAVTLYELFEEITSPLIEKNKKEVIDFIVEINNEVLSQNSTNKIAVELKDLLNEIIKVNSFEITLLILGKIRHILFTKDGFVRNLGYLRKNRDSFIKQMEIIQNYFAAIQEFIIAEDHNETELELAKFGKLFIKYFSETLAVYEDKKRQNGYLDFEDILIHTKNILEKEEVRKALSDKFKFIMVDEYQDTNEIQYEIFMPILEYLKKGNLFVVGDEKQSIYMFRDAELEIFNKTKNEIAQATDKKNLLILPHSFRMAPNICLFTNYVFSRLFSEPNTLYNEVEYTELVCAREDLSSGLIEFILPDKNNEELSEAELISRRIIKLIKENALESGIGFKDITILCRKRKSFDELEKSFSKYRIPYSIVGGRGFYQQQLIYDVYNYLSFLLNKADDAALVGLLRSPFFSISDSEIFEISLIDGNTFWEKISGYAKQNDKFNKIRSILQKNLELAFSIDIPKLLRKIFIENSFLAVASSHSDSAQDLANLEKLINVAQNFISQGFRTLFDFVNFLLDAMETMIDEGDAVLASELDSVKIMTIHQAKGLEFKVVILYNCHDKGRLSAVKSKTVQVDKKFGILTNVPPKGNYFENYKQAPIVSLHNFIQKKKNLAELKRLLYVGITRAKDILIISAVNNEFKFSEESFMGLLLSQLNLVDNQDNLVINGEVSYLKSNNGVYTETKKKISMSIPIINNIESIEPLGESYKIYENVEKNFFANEIEDFEKEEIISATKVAVYSQCPLKYQLTYEYGYTDLFKDYKRSLVEFEFKDNENEYNFYSDVKGRIIHKILERNYSMDEVLKVIDNLIEIEIGLENIKDESLSKMKESILDIVKNYFASNTFKEIIAYSIFQNEVEIYTKETDYFLYGIIDKLILNGEEVIIIDYKTDNIEENEIKERFNQYLTQLKFYSLIIQRLYPQISKFDLRIIFLKYPDIKSSLISTTPEILNFGKEIKDIVFNIRKKKFVKNLNHCYKCSYSLSDGECIKNVVRK